MTRILSVTVALLAVGSGCVLAAGPRTDLPAADRVGPRDRFGGLRVRVSQPTGVFRTLKVGDRWMLVTPDGDAFWMLGVFSVDFGTQTYGERLQQKYQNPGDPPQLLKYNAQLLWGAQSCRRLKSWGFNTLAEYVATYASPARDVQYPGTPPMPDDAKLPYVDLVRPSSYSLRNLNNLAPGPVKTLTLGIHPRVSPDAGYWRARSTPDVFDPNFEAWVKGAVGGGPTPSNLVWKLGISTDDVDDIYGWGPGPDVPTGATHPHVGWFALVTAPTQPNGGPHYGAYQDTRVYTKYALRDFLTARYTTVASLNAAWAARYTTFDSDGGWPNGKGLLDESGQNRWVGSDASTLNFMTRAARKDLDDFLYLYAQQYFISVTRPIRQGRPRGTPGYPLIMGPATLNGWAGLTRIPILRAAGEYLDVVQVNLTATNLERTMAALGDVPVTTWQSLPANPDSALWKVRSDWGVATQAARGQGYSQMIEDRLNLRTAAGTHPVVGIKWWAWLDSFGEGRNFGLVSFLDNAYDGKEAIRKSGVDAWGYRTGGEEKDYGDFLTLVGQANRMTLSRLAVDLRRATSPAR